MLKQLLFVLVFTTYFSCNLNRPDPMEIGTWRAELQLTDTEILPFNFEVTAKESLKIFNAEEVIQVNEITYSNDTVRIQMPVFEGYIEAVHSKGKLTGNFINESLGRVVPFFAEIEAGTRFYVENSTSNIDVSGQWETMFSPDSEADQYIAKGIFKQEDGIVTGTFRTTTGDYRYLEGVLDGNIMKLSTFDGAHAFLFTAEVNDSTMNGTFYSGNHWEEPFTAKRNENFELPDANELTFLKEGYEQLEFSFPDAEGNLVSLADERFKDKVVVVQIMGSWCPNCLDESRYFSEYYNNNSEKDLEFVALAFEYAKSEKAAFKNIKRLEESLAISYPILLAQHGSSNKAEAQDKLPMLNHVLSYPTSIFIDKKGKVRKIHTGFNGSATGEKFTAFKAEFIGFMDELLMEELN